MIHCINRQVRIALDEKYQKQEPVQLNVRNDRTQLGFWYLIGDKVYVRNRLDIPRIIDILVNDGISIPLMRKMHTKDFFPEEIQIRLVSRLSFVRLLNSTLNCLELFRKVTNRSMEAMDISSLPEQAFFISSKNDNSGYVSKELVVTHNSRLAAIVGKDSNNPKLITVFIWDSLSKDSVVKFPKTENASEVEEKSEITNKTKVPTATKKSKH